MLDLELQDQQVKLPQISPFIACSYSKPACSVRSGFTIFAELFKENFLGYPRP